MQSRLLNFLKNRIGNRPPDVVIGGHENPYLLRWWIIPPNRVLSLYLHLFLRSDDDRALHDHPASFFSLLLGGSYIEHEILAGGVHARTEHHAGDWRFRAGSKAHRIELNNGPCWTLFAMGPRYRKWGFHCLNGWRHWEEFTAPGDKGVIGRGCE